MGLLKDELLKKATGGGILDVPITEDMLSSFLGCTWLELETKFQPLLTDAKTTCPDAVNCVETLFSTKTGNLGMLNTYKQYLTELSAFASTDPKYFESKEIIDLLLSYFN